MPSLIDEDQAQLPILSLIEVEDSQLPMPSMRLLAIAAKSSPPPSEPVEVMPDMTDLISVNKGRVIAS